MVLTFWELDHEEILIVVRACGYRECYLIMISPLLLEDRKEEIMAVVEPDDRAAKNRCDSLYERYMFPRTVFGSSSFPGTILLVVDRCLKAGLS